MIFMDLWEEKFLFHVIIWDDGSIKSKDICFGKGIWDDKLIVQAWVWPMQ